MLFSGFSRSVLRVIKMVLARHSAARQHHSEYNQPRLVLAASIGSAVGDVTGPHPEPTGRCRSFVVEDCLRLGDPEPSPSSLAAFSDTRIPQVHINYSTFLWFPTGPAGVVVR